MQSVADARFYADFQGLSALKTEAASQSDDALDAVARQFESLLLQMMLKSMRDASLAEGIFESDQGLFYRDLYDKQLALNLSQSGGLGLADVIKQQLGGAKNEENAIPGSTLGDYQAIPVTVIPAEPRTTATKALQPAGTPSTPTADSAPAANTLEVSLDGEPDSFLRELWPLAEQAATELGLSPEALLAQAALESGWGGHMIRDGRGRNSHNLFGIKADHRWQGERARVSSLEFEQGIAVRKRSDFRAYDSYADSFRDYVDFIKDSPRYQEALGKAGDTKAYFEALQQAGYATDPEYADKIERILSGEQMRNVVNQPVSGESVRLPAGV